MTKTAFLLTLIVTALANMPAQAQQVRGFVSSRGVDTNPCTVDLPCRTFQQAFNTIPANGVIWVLDPAGLHAADHHPWGHYSGGRHGCDHISFV
jgi:hypothetical protein